jgi:hypothetical protein
MQIVDKKANTPTKQKNAFIMANIDAAEISSSASQLSSFKRCYHE